MNFKFTKAKTIISLIVGLLAGYSGKYWYVGDNYLEILLVRILTFIVIFGLAYLIWSLIQKKR